MMSSPHISDTPNPLPPMQRLDDGTFEFGVDIVEVVILDRRGHAIWQTRRSEGAASVRWDGLDLSGAQVAPGAYTCKLSYEDHHVVYVPFVYMQ